MPKTININYTLAPSGVEITSFDFLKVGGKITLRADYDLVDENGISRDGGQFEQVLNAAQTSSVEGWLAKVKDAIAKKEGLI